MSDMFLDTVPPVEVKKLDKKAPKEPRFRKGLDQATWQQKVAEMTVAEIPEGYLKMSEIVSKARDAGIKTSRICSAMGGDRALGEPWDPVFKVVYVGGRKYASGDILTKGFELLKDEEFHKSAPRGRKKAAEGEEKKEKPTVVKRKSWG